MSCTNDSFPVVELHLPQYGYLAIDYYWYTVPDETDIDATTGEPVKVAVDVTDYTARMTVRPTYSGSETFTLTTENAGIALGTTNGKITLVFTEINTALLTADSYVADLLMIDAAGDPHRLLDFIIVPRPGATILP